MIHLFTTNSKKIEQFKMYLQDINVMTEFKDNKNTTIEILEIQGTSAVEVVTNKVEQLKKYSLTSGFYLVEDTSMFIEGLDKFPGPYIKDFYRGFGCDAIVKMFAGRKATLVSAIGIYDASTGKIYVVHGEQDVFIVDYLHDTLTDIDKQDFDCIISDHSSGIPFCIEDKKTFRFSAIEKLKILLDQLNEQEKYNKQISNFRYPNYII